jgi:hypothetical protein
VGLSTKAGVEVERSSARDPEAKRLSLAECNNLSSLVPYIGPWLASPVSQ